MADEPSGKAIVSKREAVERILQNSPALLHVDPQFPGVAVPDQMVDGPVVRLQVSWHYAHPLTLADDAICQRLTFPGPFSFDCEVPWGAVFAVGKPGEQPNFVWPEDLPGVRSTMTESPEAEPEPEPPKRPQLKLIKS